jgi:hypothetical protein
MIRSKVVIAGVLLSAVAALAVVAEPVLAGNLRGSEREGARA